MNEPIRVRRSGALKVWRLSCPEQQGGHASFRDRSSSCPHMDKRDRGRAQESIRQRCLENNGRE